MLQREHDAPALEPDGATSWFVERLESSVLDPGSGEGRTALVDRSAPCGHMAPLHTRDEEETYRVVDGAVTFFVGAETVAAGRGEVVVAPAGVARTFRVESDRARWLVLTRVRSVARFNDFGRAASPPAPHGLAGGWLHSDEAASVANIGRENGIELLGAPGVLPLSE